MIHSRVVKLVGSAVVAVVALLASADAGAQTASEAALATELFNAGRDAMKSGDYAAACPKLAESARLDAKVGTLARLAECDEATGKLALARTHWQQAKNLADATRDPRAGHAESELARIDRVVPKIEIACAGEVPAKLELDHVVLGPGSLGVKLPVDPGPHTVTASGPGRRTWSTSVESKADGSVSSVRVPVLALEDAAAAPGPAPGPPPASPPAPASDAVPWRTIGIGAVGVGVVGLGVGTVFGLVAKSKRDESNRPGGCVGNDCPPDAADLRNAARSAGTISTVAFVAGGVFAAAGLTMIVAAPSSATTRQAWVGATWTSAGPTASLRGVF